MCNVFSKTVLVCVDERESNRVGCINGWTISWHNYSGSKLSTDCITFSCFKPFKYTSEILLLMTKIKILLFHWFFRFCNLPPSPPVETVRTQQMGNDDSIFGTEFFNPSGARLRLRTKKKKAKPLTISSQGWGAACLALVGLLLNWWTICWK